MRGGRGYETFSMAENGSMDRGGIARDEWSPEVTLMGAVVTFA